MEQAAEWTTICMKQQGFPSESEFLAWAGLFSFFFSEEKHLSCIFNAIQKSETIRKFWKYPIAKSFAVKSV